MQYVLSLITIATFSSSFSWAQTATQTNEVEHSHYDVMPASSGRLSNVVIDSQVTTSKPGSFTRVNLHLSCYATNLRNIGNAVSANSYITAILDVKTSAGVNKTIQVGFPADYLKPAATRLAPDAASIAFVQQDDTGTKINAWDNTIQLLIPNLKEMTITSDGEVANVSEKNLILSGIRFAQSGAPGSYGGPYFGYNGPLSSRVTWYTSLDGKSVDIYASFPGAAQPGQRAQYLGETRTGFCGGYYSPLMLFFDDSLPQFNATTRFSLAKAQAGKVYWPEAGSTGYFLALDKKGDSQILDGSQLFGDTSKFANGFQNLSSYDKNKDGVIDKKDPIFKDLRLWRDENADGVSQKKEVVTLKKMGVTSINLKIEYETKIFGERAQYKEKSTFTFENKGKAKTGYVYDIWFSPAPLEDEPK